MLYPDFEYIYHSSHFEYNLQRSNLIWGLTSSTSMFAKYVFVTVHIYTF